DDNEWLANHICIGKLKKIEEKTAKMKDKPVTVMEIALRIYKRLESGVIVVDIDTRTQRIIINGDDILKGSRRLALMA
ncbi:phage major tail tube protein, partial [Pseudomonas viridiflava]|uniref:phage major tail tube protein n=1 Tax=Pseudomonas viridiflava TaxID=33069 RepID=UPI001980DE57